MESSSTFWLLDITDWWHQQEEKHPQYANLSIVAEDIFPIIPHGVGVEASISLGWDIIGWRQSKATGGMPWEIVAVRQFAWANNAILAGDYSPLDYTETKNNLQLKKEVEERTFHKIAKVHDILEMW